ncbi:hypothetical protein U8527_18895 [Kordia algicida OT-1]|uniref:Uncharacterized protein n=1 Tax=Kordia algicida OT-1 TaxID=391587 RepID=A9DJB8_9FLAO|nr:hypothetical protein [Kordia algicida]EDP98069.1 hypothetical protein KAOT1_12667 [Kordia algicida OT-1]
MKKLQLKNLQLNKKSIAEFNTSALKGGLSGWACENPSEQPSEENPMDSWYRSICIGCEESNGILC